MIGQFERWEYVAARPTWPTRPTRPTWP